MSPWNTILLFFSFFGDFYPQIKSWCLQSKASGGICPRFIISVVCGCIKPIKQKRNHVKWITFVVLLDDVYCKTLFGAAQTLVIAGGTNGLYRDGREQPRRRVHDQRSYLLSWWSAAVGSLPARRRSPATSAIVSLAFCRAQGRPWALLPGWPTPLTCGELVAFQPAAPERQRQRIYCPQLPMDTTYMPQKLELPWTILKKEIVTEVIISSVRFSFRWGWQQRIKRCCSHINAVSFQLSLLVRCIFQNCV